MATGEVIKQIKIGETVHDIVDSKVTSVDNHYAPSKDENQTLSIDANSTTEASWGVTSLVTGIDIQRDAAGHVTEVTLDSIKMPSKPTDASTLNGVSIFNGWNGIPHFNSDGVMEAARYIDFHFDASTSGKDYSTRLECHGNTGNRLKLPTDGGTIALVENLDDYLSKNGGTMIGNITLSQNSGGLILDQTNGNGKTNIYMKPNGGSNTSIISLSSDGDVLQLGSATFNTLIKGSSTTFSGTATATAFYQSSDERLKTFTEDYDVNLDDIKNIKTGRFYWNSDENQVINGGVSAQTVEAYFPELVQESEDGIKSVNYDGLAVVAIAAIKKLTERIEQLEDIIRNK